MPALVMIVTCPMTAELSRIARCIDSHFLIRFNKICQWSDCVISIAIAHRRAVDTVV